MPQQQLVLENFAAAAFAYASCARRGTEGRVRGDGSGPCARRSQNGRLQRELRASEEHHPQKLVRPWASRLADS